MNTKDEKLRVIAWGTYDLGKPRVRILLRGLRENGVEVLECHRDVWQGVEDKSQVAGWRRKARFIGKWLILQSSLGGTWMPWVLGVLLVTSLLAVMALARSGNQLFFKIDPGTSAGAATRLGDLTAPVLLVLIGIAMVVYAGPVYEFSQAAAIQLMQPDAYLDAVLQTSAGVMTR